MRIRATVAGIASLLALAACSTEAGPTPNPAALPPGPDALRTELDAQMTDACFRAPAEQNPPGCEKYVTQLASTPDVVDNFAGRNNPDLIEAAGALREGVRAYRDNGCAGEQAGSTGACSQALVDIATALRGIDSALAPTP